MAKASLPAALRRPILAAMKPYRPSIRSLQEDWARRISHQLMRKRRRRHVAPSKITDNSVPWMENPRSVADYWFIAENVNQTVLKWRPQATNSSDT